MRQIKSIVLQSTDNVVEMHKKVSLILWFVLFCDKVKKIQKNIKKMLDKEKKLWYNSQAVREEREARSLKIEQQERSTKQKRSAKYWSRQKSLYTQTK